MFGVLKKLTGRDTMFLKPEYYETDRVLNNPCRGWYRMYTWKMNEAPDREQLSWCNAFELLFVLADISAFRDREIDETSEKNLIQLMEILARLKRDVIIRFAYDTEGYGLKNEPADFSLVLSHIESVSRILSDYDKQIFVFQGLFVGSWGEMHLSKFIDADRQVQMTAALRKHLPYTYFATRRPYYYRSMYKRVMSDHKTGLFDDGIFGSEDDLGTFGTEEKNRVGWSRPWSKAEELEFIGELASFAPIGGETVYPQVLGNKDYLASEDGIDSLYSVYELMKNCRDMNLTYLNRDYDTRIYEELNGITWERDDAFYGDTALEYLESHLGYRFYVDRVDTKIFSHDDIYKNVHFDIYIANSGFARIYMRTKLRLLIRDRRVPIDFQMSDIEPGHIRRVSFDAELEAGDKVHLELVRDNEDEDVISFANVEKSGIVYLGELKNIVG